ncbi:RibD family protein [Pseudonocardia sp. HH130630-07]|uniref:RibD family protein n=1 Tax=Pseudonocardia sp. HH130630-07 TaxID=1690815 RepID=UPI0008150AEA|nr:RibD family protein [Pseudonocardia sp. HH130630-07]ANY07967.1 deaminase [Pseudonocardia sp. HH130630-07]
MSDRPHVLASVAASLDGYIDDTGPQRLVLSGADDLDRVDGVRAGVDAILVGANTVRSDDPRLLVRSADRRRERTARGLPPTPRKVVLSSDGRLDPASRFFTTGDVEKIVYTTGSAAGRVRDSLGTVATVVGAGDPVDLHGVLADLAARGIGRLMVEGGGAVHTRFLAAGVVDELHLVYAPFLLGTAGATRFAGPAAFPQGPGHRMTLAEARPVGDCVLLRYLPAGPDA